MSNSNNSNTKYRGLNYVIYYVKQQFTRKSEHRMI